MQLYGPLYHYVVDKFHAQFYNFLQFFFLLLFKIED